MTARSDIATRLRLASGLVLMAFACTHLLNHALGIHSLAAMEAGARIFTAVWRTVPATLLLYAALATHVTLALHKLWRRRSLRMPPWEMAQVALGLLIPSGWSCTLSAPAARTSCSASTTATPMC